jgi:pyruvate,water dikinase
MITTLSQRARTKNWFRGWLVHFFLSRAHILMGFREMARFVVGLRLAQTRTLLFPIGDALVQAGRLNERDDIFFLSFSEIQSTVKGTDQRVCVSERKTTFHRELKRRHVPLVLLSDGTEPAPVSQADKAADALRGTPASPGRVTALARVILDPNLAQITPGEILVAPSTDPGWTPLFLHAAGLVMEVGGAMAHGAIVAREYGIPAVVAVPDATKRILTGSRITVDGTSGRVIIEPPSEEVRET